MNIRPLVTALVVTLTYSLVLGTSPTFAQMSSVVSTTPVTRTSRRDPLQYFQRATNAKGELLRHLSLFRDGRVVLTTLYKNRPPESIQTGTWRQQARANRLSLVLTRQSNKRYRETILLTGNPARGGMLSGVGENARQYGVYGLNFSPRPQNGLVFKVKPNILPNGSNDGTLEINANSIQPMTVSHVSNAMPTADGLDVAYWSSGGGGGYQNEGQSLFYFSTLTGVSRKLATFPFRILKVRETSSRSGRPVLVVSLMGSGTKSTGVAIVDPLQERIIKQWNAARLVGLNGGILRIQPSSGTTAASLETIVLDRLL